MRARQAARWLRPAYSHPPPHSLAERLAETGAGDADYTSGVTRIIAGFAGSLQLGVPPAGTRPTTDRVREAIFSALDARDALRGARVLDLFAGSGALGLEAASRGAAEVVLVDRARTAVELCRRNTALVLRQAPVDARPKVTVVAQSASAFLGNAPSSAGHWDVVFLDPPYDDAMEPVLDALVPHLAPGAMVVLERSVRSPAPELPPGLTLDRRKDYGDTAVYWLTSD